MYVRGESRAFFPNKIDNQYVYAEGFLRLTVTASQIVLRPLPHAHRLLYPIDYRSKKAGRTQWVVSFFLSFGRPLLSLWGNFAQWLTSFSSPSFKSSMYTVLESLQVLFFLSKSLSILFSPCRRNKGKPSISLSTDE